ncbi:MAG: hypothetical protein IJI46_00905 [Erysipelotrichaceae bacterium]|nr:hypothetical protein [Erysipelotrichaceae bacterium]
MERYMIIKLNKDADGQKLFKELSTLFKEATKIEGVRKADVYISNHDLKGRYDLMIKIRMKKKALKDFEVSDLNQKWQKDYSEYIEKLTVFDC